MLARVKQEYAAGSVMAFSGREYIRNEWREVPAGFEEQAKSHPLLDTQLSTDEIRAAAPALPGLGNPEPEPTPPAVSTVTEAPQAAAEPAAPATPAEEKPAETEPESKTPRSRRPRAAKD